MANTNTTPDTLAERIHLKDEELRALLRTPPRLHLRSATHVVREFGGKFELYTIDAGGLEMFVGYLDRA